ncbi:P-type conjugative transfer protein TrbJ [Novosphingobium resinovorum]|uniref:P-type conjugative transfer protein TrbJ n=1 Tax=Novosphingobium resinovorum TaxID=158500 RepID=A0A1D8A2S5_9SPHN|nr:P-type conjugative transfer protein TrbJ [Novosphingobium resinovorum]AOR76370.1 P-type conjugative transfer protein TrbJ [Novosphingobium resinovorum]
MKLPSSPRALSRPLRHLAAPVLLAAGILASACLLPGEPARALVVYDPTNYAQNVLTAARSLEQITNQIKALQNQATSLANQAKNLTTVDFPELDALTRTLGKIESLMGQAASIDFKVSNLETQYAALYPEAFNSSLKLDQQVTAARSRLDAQVAAYRQTMLVQAQIVENVEGDRETLTSLTNRSQLAQGSLQAAQVSNQLLALIAKQQLQIQQLLAAQFRSQAIDNAGSAQAASVSQGTTAKFLGSGSAYTAQ